MPPRRPAPGSPRRAGGALRALRPLLSAAPFRPARPPHRTGGTGDRGRDDPPGSAAHQQGAQGQRRLPARDVPRRRPQAGHRAGGRRAGRLRGRRRRPPAAAVLQAPLLRGARRPARPRGGRALRLGAAHGRRRDRRHLRRQLRPHQLRARPAGLAQRQQGQDHRLHPSGGHPRDVEPPAAAARRPGHGRRRAARGLRRRTQVARLLGGARDAPPRACGPWKSWTATATCRTAGSASAPCAWDWWTSPRRPTRSPT